MVLQPVSPILQRLYRNALKVVGSPPLIDTETPIVPVVQLNREWILQQAGVMEFTHTEITGSNSVTSPRMGAFFGLGENQFIVIRSGWVSYAGSAHPTNAYIQFGQNQIYYTVLQTSILANGGRNMLDFKGNTPFLQNTDVVNITVTAGTAGNLWDVYFAYEIWEVPFVAGGPDYLGGD